VGSSQALVERSDRAETSVAAFLREQALPLAIKCAPELAELAWSDAGITACAGGGEQSDVTTVTKAFCGIAETGTLVAASSAIAPAALGFTPENHIALLEVRSIVGTMEDAWRLLRERYGARTLPRTVNLIAGTSLTGDIGQKLVRGAHGPRRLHVVLI
jgi:L-lactate dehydrogenase complex protein LldG